jgi:hypothetical protein
MAPDGKRYIVGAEIVIIAPEDVLDAVAGGTKTARSAGVPKKAEQPDDVSRHGGAKKDGNSSEPEAIEKLEQTERNVISHENAHKAAAGRFGGAIHYSYTMGPDGKRYITGGEVPIHTPATKDPEEALQNALQVMRAALAPGDPSGQDIAVAANAAATASAARAQISSGLSTDSDGATGVSRHDAENIRKSYSGNMSPKGLWSAHVGYGRDEKPGGRNAPQLDIAA